MMAGAPVIAGFVAQAVFWILLVYRTVSGESTPIRVGAFAAIWLAGRVAIPRLLFDPFGMLFTSFVAVLDIVLVLIIFKGDIRLR
jgi:hypothetical protein